MCSDAVPGRALPRVPAWRSPGLEHVQRDPGFPRVGPSVGQLVTASPRCLPRLSFNVRIVAAEISNATMA
ncbi:hypothetical protein AESSP_00643 [Aestuariimicrobium sp. T2.26MG-19.2B]|nr:hypothetical protein AESSP_00643 [Aestuariimicrobium sp. T2.26MG-19.2B]